jgi:hypothetical protein
VAVDDPDRSVGANDAADDVDGGGRLDAGGDGELDPLAVGRVDRCEEHIEALDGVLRQAEDTGELDRPLDLTGVDLPGPAPDGGDALRLRQVRFAAGEAFGRLDALGDVLEHPADARRMPLVVAVDDLATADDVPDGSVRPHDPVLDLVLVALPGHELGEHGRPGAAVVGVDQLHEQRAGDRLARLQAQDPEALRRVLDAPALNVPLPAAHPADALSPRPDPGRAPHLLAGAGIREGVRGVDGEREREPAVGGGEPPRRAPAEEQPAHLDLGLGVHVGLGEADGHQRAHPQPLGEVARDEARMAGVGHGQDRRGPGPDHPGDRRVAPDRPLDQRPPGRVRLGRVHHSDAAPLAEQVAGRPVRAQRAAAREDHSIEGLGHPRGAGEHLGRHLEGKRLGVETRGLPV